MHTYICTLTLIRICCALFTIERSVFDYFKYFVTFSDLKLFGQISGFYVIYDVTLTSTPDFMLDTVTKTILYKYIICVFVFDFAFAEQPDAVSTNVQNCYKSLQLLFVSMSY